MRRSVRLALLSLLAPLAPTLTPQLSAQQTTVLKAARLIDGTGSAPVANGVVVVTGNRIVAVGREGSVTIPAGARTIDLGDATLLPGFIDAHTHIIGRPLSDPQYDDAPVRDYPSYGAIVGVENARKTLMSGFTTIRVLGSPNFDDMALRRGAISAGMAVGPRMQNAGDIRSASRGATGDERTAVAPVSRMRTIAPASLTDRTKDERQFVIR